MEVEFPQGKLSAAAGAAVSAALLVLSVYLTSSSQVGARSFALSYTAAFAASFAAMLALGLRRISLIASTAIREGECSVARRGGARELAYPLLAVYALLGLFLMLDPVVALGVVAGVVTAKGFADALRYAYARAVERRSGVRLRAFVEGGDVEGWYRLVVVAERV